MQKCSHGISNGGARLRNFGPFFPNCILIINSYTGLVTFGNSHIKCDNLWQLKAL